MKLVPALFSWPGLARALLLGKFVRLWASDGVDSICLNGRRCLAVGILGLHTRAGIDVPEKWFSLPLDDFALGFLCLVFGRAGIQRFVGHRQGAIATPTPLPKNGPPRGPPIG